MLDPRGEVLAAARPESHREIEPPTCAILKRRNRRPTLSMSASDPPSTGLREFDCFRSHGVEDDP